jgi:hypothetical protein
MKILSTITILGLLLIASAVPAGADASGSGARILIPGTLSNTVGLEFGQIGVSSSAGTVTVSTAGVRSSLGGVTLAGATPVTPASFEVVGEPDGTYTVTLPVSTAIVFGAESMTVDTFASLPATTGTLNGEGADVLVVGATLHVGANQAAGLYAGSFDVTVLYN